MSLYELILVILASGYAALTCMGISVTLGTQDFVNDAVGRNTTLENPPWYYYVIALIYIVMYMWAVGLVATWSGGKTLLYLTRARETMNDMSNPLSAEETRRLQAACDDLEETSRFKG